MLQNVSACGAHCLAPPPRRAQVNPPLYGADTPTSLFDRHVPWGWNLRRLDCLLKDYDLPKIPGVNTPMAYFGSELRKNRPRLRPPRVRAALPPRLPHAALLASLMLRS